jgi:flavin-dependent dehydrogenase
VPAYQVDRATLDTEVLQRAQALGAEIIRPAAVQKVDLGGGRLADAHDSPGRPDRNCPGAGSWMPRARGFGAAE